MLVDPGKSTGDGAIGRRFRLRLAPLARDGAGAVSIEFALVAIILGVLGIGMFDFGRYALLHSRAYNAARAGAQFGTLNPSRAGNINGMRAAAFDDADLDINNPPTVFTVDARSYCLCPGLTTAQACGTTCSDGNFAPRFVEVEVTDQLELLFDYPGFPAMLDINTLSRMRVQ